MHCDLPYWSPRIFLLTNSTSDLPNLDLDHCESQFLFSEKSILFVNMNLASDPVKPASVQFYLRSQNDMMSAMKTVNANNI